MFNGVPAQRAMQHGVGRVLNSGKAATTVQSYEEKDEQQGSDVYSRMPRVQTSGASGDHCSQTWSAGHILRWDGNNRGSPIIPVVQGHPSRSTWVATGIVET